MTAAGAMLGTPQYMAPEQFADSSKVDSRADLYALGVMMYEAGVGVLPFDGSNVASIMKAVLQDEVRPPSRIVDGFPARLESMILSCLSRDPNGRPDSAEAVYGFLDQASREFGLSPIKAAEVPRVDLEARGFELTGQISSAALDTAEVPPSPEAVAGSPETVKKAKRPAPGPGESWAYTVAQPAGRGRKVLLALSVLVSIAGAVAGTAWYMSDQDDKTEKREGISTSSPVAADSGDGDVRGGGDSSAAQESAAMPARGIVSDSRRERRPPASLERDSALVLPVLPLVEGVSLGRSCDAASTSLVGRVANARLLSGWRGLALEALEPRQLEALDVSKRDLVAYQQFLAVQAGLAVIENLIDTILGYFPEGLDAADLGRLAQRLRGPGEVGAYVRAMARFKCATEKPRMLQRLDEMSSVMASPGELMNEISREEGLQHSLLDLKSEVGSDSIVKAEWQTRALCCLLSDMEAR